MDDNDITIIMGVEAQGSSKAIWEAEKKAIENTRHTAGNNDQTMQRLPEQFDTSHPQKEATNSGTFQKGHREELTRSRDLIMHSGSSGETPSPSKLNLKASQAFCCVSNHIAKATFHTSTTEQNSGQANSASTEVLACSSSRGTPTVANLPVRSKTPIRLGTPAGANTPTFVSASTPCISIQSPFTTTTPPADPLTPIPGINRSRTFPSISARSFFRNLKSALKGKGKATEKQRSLSFPLRRATGSTAESTVSLPQIPTTSRPNSSTHLPLKSILHGLRRGYKPVRSLVDGTIRMLPAPVIETHQPSFSPPPIPPPASTIKRKRDIWKNLKAGSSSTRKETQITGGRSRKCLLDDEDAASVVDLGHIPLPSPLVFETCTLAPPNPDPKYTVTIHLSHPGQKIEYEMDNMTGHLIIMVYTPHSGFSTISGVVGGGSSRPALESYDDSDDDPYNYNRASNVGGIWIPQQWNWNGLRVCDWGTVSGKVVLQFPEFVRRAGGSGGEWEEWGETDVVAPDMSEEVLELDLDDADLDAVVIREGKWDPKGKGKGRADVPQGRTGSKKKGKGKESTDGEAVKMKTGSRYDLRPRS